MRCLKCSKYEFVISDEVSIDKYRNFEYTKNICEYIKDVICLWRFE